MAQGVVIRFKADSTEYDARLKRSIEHMKQMENEANKLNGTVDRTDKSYIKFVQSLGSMETKANSAKGKINEMTQAFVELSVQYNKLTKEEKSGAYGKALASSLDQLKSRIKGAKSELAGIEGQLTGIGDVFKQVGSKMGIPMEMFTKLGPVVAAAGAAIKVATDVFRQNEELMDEWGRTTEAAGTVYQGFLNALNTGDIGGFLRNIGKIISKSREAYDAMDQLGTFNAFNQIQIEGARTNFTEAMANYREGSGTKEDVKAAADRLKNEMQSRQDKEQAAYIAAIKELAASRGVDEEMLQKALSGTYGDYETLKNTPLTRHEEQIWNGNMFGKTTTTKVTWSADTMEQKLGESLRKLSDDELARIQSLGAQAQRTATEIAQVDKQVTRVLGANKGGGTTPSSSTPKPIEGTIAWQEKEVARLRDLWKNAGDAVRDEYKANLDSAQAVLDKMLGKTDKKFAEGSLGYLQQEASQIQSNMSGVTTNEEYRELDARLNAILEKINEIKGITKIVFAPGSLNDLNQQLRDAQAELANMSPEAEGWADALEKVREKMAAVAAIQDQINGKGEAGVSNARSTGDAWQNAVAAVNNVGSALQQIEDPAAKVSGIVMQAVANIALGFAQAAASPATGAAGVFGWIAAATAGVATMVSTIAAIKSATSGSYASGGIVPGSSFSGDNLTANVNSGELILNRAQQGAIAGQLQGAAQQTVMVEGRIRGKDILLSANNTNRAAGGSRGYYTKVK